MTDQVEVTVERGVASRLVHEVGHRTFVWPAGQAPGGGNKGIWGVLIEVRATPSACTAVIVPDEPEAVTNWLR
jgi:hypothetical protein